MKSIKKLATAIARRAAEQAIRRDANQTSCVLFYQPKAPAKLENFKKKIEYD